MKIGAYSVSLVGETKAVFYKVFSTGLPRDGMSDNENIMPLFEKICRF